MMYVIVLVEWRNKQVYENCTTSGVHYSPFNLLMEFSQKYSNDVAPFIHADARPSHVYMSVPISHYLKGGL